MTLDALIRRLTEIRAEKGFDCTVLIEHGQLDQPTNVLERRNLVGIDVRHTVILLEAEM